MQLVVQPIAKDAGEAVALPVEVSTSVRATSDTRIEYYAPADIVKCGVLEGGSADILVEPLHVVESGCVIKTGIAGIICRSGFET